MKTMIKISLIILLVYFPFTKSLGQAIPFNPYSYRISSPFVFNPAMAGNKDFSSINTIVAFQGESTSQIISGEGRLSKKSPSYFLVGESLDFSGFGIGGTIFNEKNAESSSKGASASIAYHIPVSKDKLSYLSFGASFKGVLNTLDYSISEELPDSPSTKKTFFPNIDFGIYFYGKNFYAGFSANNLTGNPEEADSLGNFEIPVSQQYVLNIGYKILLVKSMNIVLEPSFIYEFDSFDPPKDFQSLQPLIKLYMEDFCLGMIFNDKNMNSFFFQYHYPGFYLGAFYGIVKNVPFYLNKPRIEISLGVNLSRDRFRVSIPSHW